MRWRKPFLFCRWSSYSQAKKRRSTSLSFKSYETRVQTGTIQTFNHRCFKFCQHNNVVYKISCNSRKSYVGQTKRRLRIRLDEHFKNFNLNGKFHNVISKHRKKYEKNQENHSLLWNDVKILHKERDRYKRAFSEMVFIKKENDNSLNKITDIGHLNSSYNMILNFLSW